MVCRVCVWFPSGCMASRGCVVGRGHAWLSGGHAWFPGGMHGWQGGMHGEGGVHAVGGMHGKGACMAKGGMHGKGGCAWQRGGHAWQRGGMHGEWGHVWQRGACMVGTNLNISGPMSFLVAGYFWYLVPSGGEYVQGGISTRYGPSMRGWYASYWNAFLFVIYNN